MLRFLALHRDRRGPREFPGTIRESIRSFRASPLSAGDLSIKESFVQLPDAILSAFHRSQLPYRAAPT